MSDKTEPPTTKKLRDARKKGQVAKSKEVSSAAVIIAVFGALVALFPTFVGEVQQMILLPTHFYNVEFGLAANAVLSQVAITSLLVTAPVIVVAAVIAIVANMAQVGMLFTAEPLKPKLSNLNPASGLKKMVSPKNLFEFLKSAVKIAFLSLLLFIVIRSSLQDLVKIPHCGLGCIPTVAGKLLFEIMIYTVAAFVIVAAADFVYQKAHFMKEMRMSKEEIKKEYKEMEGDPHIKGKRKQLHHELMQSDTDAAVRKSKVVVTNPTHIAVALDYQQGETPLPVIRAMGQNIQAKRIIKIAQEAGIPIMQNVPVARGLYENGKLNQYIPSDMIEAVAEIFRWVRELEEEQAGL